MTSGESTTEQAAPDITISGSDRLASRNWHLDRYATPIFMVLFFTIITTTQGSSFAGWSNLSVVLGSSSYLAFLAAAAATTLIAGQFDLSIGACAGTSAILTAYITSQWHLNSLLACVLVALFGALVGLVNAWLVLGFHINAFIATLATSGALAGVAQWVSGGQTLFQGIPASLTRAGTGTFMQIPYPVYYALAVFIVMWVMSRRSVLGRHWYASGANPTAARLAGVNVTRATAWAFAVSGVLAGLAGVLSTARFGSADPAAGPDLLLPAFAAAFLGSTILSDGAFSVSGAVIAAFLIQLAENGLDVAGVNVAVQPIFNGLVLAGAVALTEYFRRRRSRFRVDQAAGREVDAGSQAAPGNDGKGVAK
jgi:ribose transport system permease protein